MSRGLDAQGEPLATAAARPQLTFEEISRCLSAGMWLYSMIASLEWSEVSLQSARLPSASKAFTGHKEESAAAASGIS